MTEFGKSPLLDFATLAGMGYRMVLYPVTTLRVGPARGPRHAGGHPAAKGHQRDRVPQMLTRAELYDLLDYSGYEERDRAYFGSQRSYFTGLTAEASRDEPSR